MFYQLLIQPVQLPVLLIYQVQFSLVLLVQPVQNGKEV